MPANKADFLGAYTALSTKGVSSLLTYRLWRVLTFPITYALVIILVATAIFQIKYLNRALQHFSSTVVIPTQFVLFTLSVILGSSILYRDFEKATPDRVLKFVAGCALTFSGVYLITSGREKEEEDIFDDYDEEEAMRLLQEDQVDDELPGETTDTETVSVARLKPGTSQVSQNASSAGSRRRGSQASDVPPSLASSLNTSLLQDPSATPARSTVGASSQHLTPEAARTQPSLSRTSSHRNEDPQGGTSRRASVSRRSISLVPGPFISPLSSSLGGVIADTLRRGVDVVTPASTRQSQSSRRSKLRASFARSSGAKRLPTDDSSELLSSSSQNAAAASDLSLPLSSEGTEEAQDEDFRTRSKSQSRSVGSALGDLLRRGRTKKPDTGDS